ncbi:MAG: acylphosphatase [Treponema sp.]|nr:acylphosphatase [Treponema sp.]
MSGAIVGSTTGATTAVSATVQGRVQGVGFRYACYHEARRLSLCGWVRNTDSGAVKVWAEGPREKLEALLRWLRQGPPGARIDRLDYSLQSPAGRYREFTIEL